MEMDNNSYFVIAKIVWGILVFGAFMNVFVRWSVFAHRVGRLLSYIRTFDSSIPEILSPRNLAGVKSFMLRMKTLPNLEIETLRQTLVSGGMVKGIFISTRIFFGILAVGVLPLILKTWLLGVAAVVVLACFAVAVDGVSRQIATGLIRCFDQR